MLWKPLTPNASKIHIYDLIDLRIFKLNFKLNNMKIKIGKFLIFCINWVILINLVNNACPTGKPAFSTNECTSITDEISYCCLLKNQIDGSPKMCYEINKLKYEGIKTIYYGVVEYLVDCGTVLPSTINPAISVVPLPSEILPISNIPPLPLNSTISPTTNLLNISDENYYGVGGSTCGKFNPMKLEDCSISSTERHSCCFYNINNKTGCYYIGDKFYGNYTKSTFPLLCGGGFINSKLFSYLILLIIFLNF